MPGRVQHAASEWFPGFTFHCHAIELMARTAPALVLGSTLDEIHHYEWQVSRLTDYVPHAAVTRDDFSLH